MKLTSIAYALIGSAIAQAAFAQASAPPSRADVKAETKAAEKAGKLTPAGEGTAPAEAPGAKSTKTRAERKAETMTWVKRADEATGFLSAEDAWAAFDRSGCGRREDYEVAPR